MERKMIYQDDAIDAIVGCTNCGTEDELRAYVTRHSLEDVWSGGIVDALDAVEQLPSAQPDQKKGEWLTSDDFYETGICSRCKWDSQEPIPYAVTNFNFCPNCGADMRGE